MARVQSAYRPSAASVKNAVTGTRRRSLRTAARRVLVHVSRLADMKDALTRALGSLKVGSGLDPATRVGPLIDRRSRDQVAQRINEACAAADEVLLAPKIPGEGLAKGAVRGG